MGNREYGDGGDTTAANRLLGAVERLTQKPGIYDGLDVPLHPPLPPEVEAQRWAD